MSDNDNREPVRKRDPYHIEYANGCRTRITPHDVTLIFSVYVEGDRQLVAQEHTEIILSPEHCRRIVDMLSETLRQWDQSFGSSLVVARPRVVQ